MRRTFSFFTLLLLLSFGFPLASVGAQASDTETPTPTFVFIPASSETPTVTKTLAVGTITATTGVKPSATSSVVEVKKADVQEDGSIIHVVEKGQALWSIGMEYGVSVENLILFNNLSAEPVLQIGQKLIVQPPYTPTPTPTASNTPFPPTPTATKTLRPITPGPTLSPTPSITPTSQPLFVGVDALKGINRRSMGIGLIIICALGLGGIIYYTIKKRRDEKPGDVDPVEALLKEKQDLDR
ncbi:MAG: LysM peptidoglycan-binding domain-containing protein [Anaerolineaceae bacterium]